MNCRFEQMTSFNSVAAAVILFLGSRRCPLRFVVAGVLCARMVRKTMLQDLSSRETFSKCKAPSTRSSRTILIGEMPMSSSS